MNLASGNVSVDPGFLLSAGSAIVLVVVFLFKTFRTRGDDDDNADRDELVEELRDNQKALRNELDDVKRELRLERDGRAEDNSRHRREMEGVRETVFELRQEIAKYRRGEGI